MRGEAARVNANGPYFSRGAILRLFFSDQIMNAFTRIIIANCCARTHTQTHTQSHTHMVTHARSDLHTQGCTHTKTEGGNVSMTSATKGGSKRTHM